MTFPFVSDRDRLSLPVFVTLLPRSERKHMIVRGKRDSFWIERQKTVSKLSEKESARNLHVTSGTTPCLNHKSESGCKYGDLCHFRHTEAGWQPSKKSKNCGKESGGIF